MVICDKPIELKEDAQKYQEYIVALEEERQKIQVFARELPLCLDIVSQAIERCKKKIPPTQYDQFSKQTSPVLEEFISIKPTSTTNEDDDEKQEMSSKSKILCSKDKSSSFSTKSDWLTSAQLSIQATDPPKEEDFLSKKLLDMEENRNSRGAFHPPGKQKTCGTNLPSLTCTTVVQTASISSSENTDGGGSGGGDDGCNGEENGHLNKKERRCWSPELHRRFLHALQQLGGARVATPKQIKELMKVDGLTNDEIKSHLQKYRLHTRRMIQNDAHTPQFMVVGQIWMPPLDYTTKASPHLP